MFKKASAMSSKIHDLTMRLEMAEEKLKGMEQDKGKMRGAGEQKENQQVIDDDAFSKSSGGPLGHTEARANSPGWTCTTITYCQY
jgi:hypothetical protein